MGLKVDPAQLTDSGERCLRRVSELYVLRLPASTFSVVVMAPVEVHVTGILGRLIGQSSESSGLLGSALIAHVGDGFFDNWDLRLKRLKEGFGLSFAGDKPYQQLSLVVETRNAMVHGDGQLTARQTAKTAALKTLRRGLEATLDISCRGLVLEPAASSVDKTVDVVRGFVAAFDGAVLAAYPAVKS